MTSKKMMKMEAMNNDERRWIGIWPLVFLWWSWWMNRNGKEVDWDQTTSFPLIITMISWMIAESTKKPSMVLPSSSVWAHRISHGYAPSFSFLSPLGRLEEDSTMAFDPMPRLVWQGGQYHPHHGSRVSSPPSPHNQGWGGGRYCHGLVAHVLSVETGIF